ncbi:MAG: hypothetical protein KDD48_06100 [Bdellovibrionales bacterium]|nr:hypothetical protein [Bdellovibrionales bacterium]
MSRGKQIVLAFIVFFVSIARSELGWVDFVHSYNQYRFRIARNMKELNIYDDLRVEVYQDGKPLCAGDIRVYDDIRTAKLTNQDVQKSTLKVQRIDITKKQSQEDWSYCEDKDDRDRSIWFKVALWQTYTDEFIDQAGCYGSNRHKSSKNALYYVNVTVRPGPKECFFGTQSLTSQSGYFR